MSQTARRVLICYLALHLVATALFASLLTHLVRGHFTNDARSRMESTALLIREHLDHIEDDLNAENLRPYLDRVAARTRLGLTVADENGTVIANSNLTNKKIGESLAALDEFRQARYERSGFSTNTDSEATQERGLALVRTFTPKDDESSTGYIHVASSNQSIERSLGEIQRYVWIFSILLGMAIAVISSLYATRAVKPLVVFSEAARRIGVGDYNVAPSPNRFTDAWHDLGEAFRQMQEELHLREERLLENYQHLEAVLSSMIEGVIAIEADGTVVLSNGAACEMLSLTRPELLGRKLIEIIRNPELGFAIDNTRLNRTFSETEFKIFTPVEKTISARVSILADVQHPGIAIVLHDVTELRQLETMRQDFVANVSHELKTPLASIKAYAETLKLGAINDQDKNIEFVEQIEASAELLNHQIQDIIQLARVESGEQAFNLVKVNFNEAAKACHERFLETARQNDIELGLDLVNPGPIAKADSEAIATILNNLVVNAIHYTPEGGSVVIQSCIDDEWAVLNVSDTGIGIGPEQQSRVFERFYRVDKARSRDIGGTGLGLAIVKHLCQSFGGSVELESQLGKGSTFRVQLPIVVAGSDELQSAKTVASH